MQGTPASKRITLVEKDGYSVDLEYTGTVAILHLPRVKKLTKSVYQDMLVTVDSIWEFLSTINYTEMYAGIPKDDQTLEKFIKKMGFVYLGEAMGIDVYQYKEYI